VSIRHQKHAAIYWRERAGYPTPEEEIRNIGLRIQRNISFKGCYTPDAIRDKLNRVIKHFREAKNVTLEPRARRRLRGKIKHTKVLRDSEIPERIIIYAINHPKSLLRRSLDVGLKKAREEWLSRIKPTVYVRRGLKGAKKRFERFHRRG
jgi:hypothetical protein